MKNSVNYLIILITLFSIIPTLTESENIKLQFMSATSKFKYAIIKPEHDKIAEHFINLSDKLLMVAIAPNLFIGPAQLRYRRVESPFEQVITVTRVEYSPIKDGFVQDQTIPYDKDGFIYSSPHYGILTLASNILFKKLEIGDIFNPSEYPVTKIIKDFKVQAGDSLLAVTLFKGKLEVRKVKVLQFSKCEALFDPEGLFILDDEEQICTQEVEKRKSKNPQTIPSSLLFSKYDKHGFVFVGITSRTRVGLSLSTFVPYHCEFMNASFKKEICV